ncbi:hypothetical protein [Allocoleopsis sp.]|uniref:hypothetical protein n=1 Tax=Allocoleopsis sp. TaxID=3088169 RepID=UPI002FD28106
MEELLSGYLSLQQEATNERTSCDRLRELAAISTDLARRVAANLSSPSELLRTLANSRDATTRSYVAANPNTPTEVLLYLGREFPEQLLNNPIFSLLWLENANVVEEMPLTTLVTLLKQESVPVFFLEQAAIRCDREVQLAVTVNAQTSRTVLEKLVQNDDIQVAEAAQLHVNWAGEMHQGWDEDAHKAMQKEALHPKNQQYIEELAKLGLIPEFIVDRLPRNKDDHKFLQAVAPNPNVNHLPHLLEQLATDKKWEFRAAVATNPNTPESLLQLLAKDKTVEVRCGVVQNPNTSEKLLKQLLSDREWKVRLVAMEAYLAQNPDDLPVMLRHQLRKKSEGYEMSDYNPSSFIRLLILFHPQIPSQALAENSRSLAWLERYAIAQHPNTPLDTLQTLALDANRLVRTAAKAHLQARR